MVKLSIQTYTYVGKSLDIYYFLSLVYDSNNLPHASTCTAQFLFS